MQLKTLQSGGETSRMAETDHITGQDLNSITAPWMALNLTTGPRKRQTSHEEFPLIAMFTVSQKHLCVYFCAQKFSPDNMITSYFQLLFIQDHFLKKVNLCRKGNVNALEFYLLSLH